MKQAATTPGDALRILHEGNLRFAHCLSHNPHREPERRISTSMQGQAPFAAVLACSDSRAPVETLFDRGVGDIFTVRVAGNVAGYSEIGSLEYAVAHLAVPLLVVLGHTSCGAVLAAIEQTVYPGHIGKLIERIVPAVSRVREVHPTLTGLELLDRTARENVWHQIESLRSQSEIVKTASESGRVAIMGAFYDLGTGQVEWMGKPSDGISMNSTSGRAGDHSGCFLKAIY